MDRTVLQSRFIDHYTSIRPCYTQKTSWSAPKTAMSSIHLYTQIPSSISLHLLIPRQIKQLPVINLHTTQQPHSRLLTAKHGLHTRTLTIRPKVHAISHDALCEGIFPPLGKHFLSARTMQSSSDKSVHTQQTLPLRKTTFRCRTRGRPSSRTTTRSLHIRRSGSSGYSSSKRAGMIITHSFPSSDRAGDLRELHEKQHSGPSQLNTSPAIDEQCKRVFGPLGAEFGF